MLAEAQASSRIERVRSGDFPLPRLPPLAPALELRNVLMIEDEASLLEGIGEGPLDNGEEVLKLDETDARECAGG